MDIIDMLFLLFIILCAVSLVVLIAMLAGDLLGGPKGPTVSVVWIPLPS